MTSNPTSRGCRPKLAPPISLPHRQRLLSLLSPNLIRPAGLSWVRLGGRLSLGRLAAVRDRRPEAWSGRPSELWPEVGGLNEIVSRPLKSSRMSIAKTEAPSFAKLRALSADFQLRLRTTLTLDFGPATRDPLIKLP